MPKGYTKRQLQKMPRASARGRIVRYSPYGRIIHTITRELPDTSAVEVQLHATKGWRRYRHPKKHLMGGVVNGG